MTNWQRLDALAGAAVDRVWAESIRITPRIAPSDYVGASPDPARPVKEVRAIFSEETNAIDLRGQRLSGESRGTTQIVNSQTAVQIVAAQAALIGHSVASGDLVTLIDRAGHPSYSVNLSDPLDCGDLILYLSPERAS